jgi:hypothetical protein
VDLGKSDPFPSAPFHWPAHSFGLVAGRCGSLWFNSCDKNPQITERKVGLSTSWPWEWPPMQSKQSAPRRGASVVDAGEVDGQSKTGSPDRCKIDLA